MKATPKPTFVPALRPKFTPSRIVAFEGRRGLAIPLSGFNARVKPALAKKILRALSTVSIPNPSQPKGVAPTRRDAYIIDRKTGVLLVPRVKGPQLMSHCIDEVQRSHQGPDACLPDPRTIEADRCDPAAPLYEYQEAAVDFLAERGGSVYLQMETGYGKSRIGCALVAKCKMPGLIVVPTKAIADQWCDEFKTLFPLMRVARYSNTVGYAVGPRTHDAVVVVVNTFRDKGPEFMEGYGVTILDEAHEYHSACNSRALWLAQTRVVLGLSATPRERLDGMDAYVEHHLGKAIKSCDIPGFNARGVNFRGEVRLIQYRGKPGQCEAVMSDRGTVSAIKTVRQLTLDESRLNLVANEVERLLNLHKTASGAELSRLGLGPGPSGLRRHGVFVFAELRDYLPSLKEVLIKRMDASEILVPEIDDPDGKGSDGATRPCVSILRGGVTKDEVDSARSAGAHVVVTTYGFSRRGISLPEMTAIVLATPRRVGSTQILGRITRRGSDESILRQVVDIVDVGSGLQGQARDRCRAYAAKSYPVTRLKAIWSDYVPREESKDDEDMFSEMSESELLSAALGEEPSPAQPIVATQSVVAAPAPSSRLAEALGLIDVEI